ncbi:MAG: helix-turn-helix domain-containing protein [bacterium]|nr:helix-turn-helix domain-containing protein [bacterium]
METKEENKESIQLSKAGKKRLRWMEHYKKYRSARLTCRHFGISPDTFYSWKKRYNPEELGSLEDRSRRPKKLRQPTWNYKTLLMVRRLREENPTISNSAIRTFLNKQELHLSPSMLSNILKRLQRIHPEG